MPEIRCQGRGRTYLKTTYSPSENAAGLLRTAFLANDGTIGSLADCC
ncbi:hypothetical protein [Chitinophaga flava]|nr:hypothetical protein [Chitinophaga flava]